MLAHATSDFTAAARRPLRPLLRVLGFACIAAAIAACGGDSGTGPSTSNTGIYRLTTYNGGPLPYTETTADTFQNVIYTSTISLNSGSITLNANHTYEEKVNVRIVFRANDPSEPAQDTTIDEGSAGTYAIQGTTLRLFSLPDTAFDGRIVVDSTQAQIASNTITFADTSDAGIRTVVFKK